ncbi:MAG: hypothetical protein F6K58_18675 [Symploca sp. SIO2E9]|nr:hypothetical protein [Symploca sp. SIO2E9]
MGFKPQRFSLSPLKVVIVEFPLIKQMRRHGDGETRRWGDREMGRQVGAETRRHEEGEEEMNNQQLTSNKQ